MKKRSDIWNDLKGKESCQVLILGGGVNGTGLMRELALQGISCILVDKGDFTAGASSTSSRMIHGGLRYLENREFKLVKEALAERNRLLRYAGHYVSPLRTSIPVDSWFAGLIKSPMIFLGLPVTVGGRGALVIKFGLLFYDIITRNSRQTPRHYFLSKTKSLKEIPGLRSNIACTATYWDAWVSQIERLCMEMVREACIENPDCLAINYVTAARRDNDKVVLTDQATGEEAIVQPEIVVNATGAWVDITNKRLGLESRFMGGTKGSHLVIDNRELYDALGDRMIYYEHSDGRICIAFRFMDKIIMGSTDIRVDNPDDAECQDDEVDYMMTTLKGVFPDLSISKDDIVFTFCGVRPLPASGLDYTSRVPRSHRTEISESDEQRSFRIYSMIGGKLTTFGAFSEQAAGMILTQLGRKRIVCTAEQPYLGARNYPTDERAKKQWIDRVASENNLTGERVSDLLDRYGTEAEKIAAQKDSKKYAPLENLPDYSIGEIEYIAENECIRHISDLVRRRSVIAITGRAGEAVLKELVDVVGRVLNWNRRRRQTEVEIALKEVKSRK